MGETAENVAALEKFKHITREQQDAFALESHKRAIAAIESGKFKDEIVGVPVKNKNGITIMDRDEQAAIRFVTRIIIKIKTRLSIRGHRHCW